MNAVLTAADKKWRTASKSKARKTEQEALNWISSPTAGTLTLQDDGGGFGWSQSRKGATRDPKGVSTHGRSHRRLHITGGEPAAALAHRT
jgi:hypothetical protein